MKKLGFGLMRLPLSDADDYKKVDISLSKEMIDYYLSNGFTYFDTAYTYHGGLSESIFGDLVASRYPREDFILTTKMPLFLINKKEQYQKIFCEQLLRCKVDYFDYYLLHCLGSTEYDKVQAMNGFEFISQKKAEGKIKHIGFSYHDDADTLDRILNDHPETEVVQLQLNYIDWDDDAIQSRRCYEVCKKHNVDVIVMEPLKGGALVNLPNKAKEILLSAAPKSSIASWGIRFAASPDNIIMVLSGMSSMDQLKDNISYMANFKPLSEAEYQTLDKAISLIKQSIAIPCTSCRYCIDSCPEKIAIPEYFALYNNQHQFGLQALHNVTFENIAANHGKPSDCVECGACSKRCPQHIDVLNRLKDIKQLFQK